MFRATVLAAITLFAALLQAAPAAAAEYGTAAEARAMLDQAVIEMKADPAAAVAKFNDADGAFRDRDLYVFCANLSDGVIVAHPNIVGTDLRTLKDVNGKPFGAEMLDGAKEGEITEVSYVWPRPDGGDPVPKNSYVIGLGEHICGVGYYE
jgi:signal transduction histidine kinase